MTSTAWRTAATEEALAFWRSHYATSARPPPDMRPCPDASRAPHGCGLIRQQRVHTADGTAHTWVCAACVDRSRSAAPRTGVGGEQ